jgi:uncharacterized protein
MRFILTGELGKLSKWLRLLGFDAEYYPCNKTSVLILEALRDNRIVVTRNQKVPLRAGVRVVLVKSESAREQVRELLKQLNIPLVSDKMFTRCTLCNKELITAEKLSVKDSVPEYVFSAQNDFFRCPQCNRIYWQGSHWGNVKHIIETL